MAEPKGGPVKPPTLDLKPRSKSAPESDTSSSAKPKTDTSSRRTSRTSASPAKSPASDTTLKPDATTSRISKGMSPKLGAVIGVVGGALLALLLIIPLALSGILQPAPKPADNAQIDAHGEQLSLNQQQITQNSAGFETMEEQIKGLAQTISEQQDANQNQAAEFSEQIQILSTQNATLSEQNASLQTLVENLQATPRPLFDPSQLETDIAALATRLDAIAAGASTEDAEKLGADIIKVQTDIEALSAQASEINSQTRTNLDSLSEALNTQNETLNNAITLSEQNSTELFRLDIAVQDLNTTTQELTRATELAAQLAEQVTEQIAEQETNRQEQNLAASDQVQQVPFALMSIEIALNNGQPFLLQLENLSTRLPDIQFPPRLLEAAAKGLATPDRLSADFSAAMPTILAARPVDPDANYVTRIGDSIKSILGLRATGLNNGDDLENLLNQTLAAINTHRFEDARTLLSQLPSPMQATLVDMSRQIDLHAAIQTLLQNARDTHALASETPS